MCISFCFSKSIPLVKTKKTPARKAAGPRAKTTKFANKQQAQGSNFSIKITTNINSADSDFSTEDEVYTRDFYVLFYI